MRMLSLCSSHGWRERSLSHSLSLGESLCVFDNIDLLSLALATHRRSARAGGLKFGLARQFTSQPPLASHPNSAHVQWLASLTPTKRAPSHNKLCEPLLASRGTEPATAPQRLAEARAYGFRLNSFKQTFATQFTPPLAPPLKWAGNNQRFKPLRRRRNNSLSKIPPPPPKITITT